MSDYSLGNLELNINVLSSKAVRSLKDIATQLTSLSGAVKSITTKDFEWLTILGNSVKDISPSLKSFSKTMSAFNTVDFTKLSAGFLQFSTAISPFISAVSVGGRALTDFARILQVAINPKFAEVSFTKLATSITPFLTQLETAKTSLIALSNIMSQLNRRGGVKGVNTGIDSVVKKAKSSGGSRDVSGVLGKVLDFGWLLAKLRMVFHLVKRIARGVQEVVQAGIDYTETLNLWQVAMRENVGLAQGFVNAMRRAYGMSERTLMNTQAIYKNMIGTLGLVSEETAYGLSESLLKMTLDFSSLYNVSFESATEKFQSMLARQIRPIRSISGYDISERSIYSLYEQMGGKKTMRQLNNTEKQLLSIYAVFMQMDKSGALMDYQKTIGETANQSRMLKENWSQFLTYLGLAGKQLLDKSKILVYLNAGLMVASEYAKQIAVFFGYSGKNFLEEMAGSLFRDFEKANDEVDELKGKLLGFDNFRVLGEQTATGNSDLEIDTTVFNAFNEYQSMIREGNNEALALADKWLGLLGFYKEAIYIGKDGSKIAKDEFEALNEEQKEGYTLTQQWTAKQEEFGVQLDNLKNTAGGIGVLIGGLVAISHPVVGILVIIGTLMATNKEFLDSVISLFTKLGDIMTPLLTMITPLLTGLMLNISKLLISLMPIVSTIIQKLADFMPPLVGIISNIVDFVAMILTFAIPILDIVLDLADTLTAGFYMLQGITSLFTYLKYPIGLIIVAISPLLALLEIMMKTLQTLGTIAIAIATLDFSKLGENISAIWSNWKLSKLGEVIKSNGIYDILPKGFAEGGLPDKGTLFVAGESGAEIVASGSNGQSAVMNMEQLESAVARGMITGMSRFAGKKGGESIVIQIDGEPVFQAITKTAKSKGLIWGNA